MKSTAEEWVKGKQQFALRDVVATDDVVSVVTQLCVAGALLSTDRTPAGLRISKSASEAGNLELFEQLADRLPNFIVCTEDIAEHKTWHLSIQAAQQVEMLHTCVQATPLFALPDVPPPTADMTTCQLALFLEERCNFKWQMMPRRQQDRIAIAFRARDPDTPRFLCFGRANLDHHYLRSLAAAQQSPSDFEEVLHGQKHSYYCHLLGLDVGKRGAPQLALDDGGEIDFPSSKRARGPLPMGDGDVEPLLLEDGDVEPLDDDGDGSDPVENDLDFEEALAAEIEQWEVEQQQEHLDDHLEDHQSEGIQDGDRERALQNPSAQNFKYGPFTFTLKRSKDSDVLSWQCSCPFHRKNPNSGCKKTMVVTSGSVLSFEAASDEVLDCLRHWANQALTFTRQRTHLAFHVYEGNAPPKDVILAQMITRPKPKKTDVPTDQELDGGSDGGSTSSSE